MAKQGFSYYKAETDRFQDIKIKRLKKRYHCTGYAVYQYVLNEIFRVRGYFIYFSEDELFDVSEYWGMEESEVMNIIDYCTEIGLFSAQLWKDEGILTAKSIQSRYIDICKVCKKTPVIEEKYRLVPPEQATPAPAPMPQLFPEENESRMRIVAKQGNRTAFPKKRSAVATRSASDANVAPGSNIERPGAQALAKLGLEEVEHSAEIPTITGSLTGTDATPLTGQASGNAARKSADKCSTKGIGSQALADLRAKEEKGVPEDFQNFPETSGSFSEKSNKSIKSYLSETKPSSNSPREEEDKASPSENGNRLRLLMQSIGCTKQDWQELSAISHIDADNSPVWQLADEVQHSGGRLSVNGYVMPSLRALIASGRLKRQQEHRDTRAELKRLLVAIHVPGYDINRILATASGQEPALRDAIEEVRRSKGRITMPTRYLLAQLHKAAQAKAS